MTSTLPSRELLNELKLAKGKNSLIFGITEDRDGLSQLLKSNNFDVRLIDLRDNGNLLQMLVDWKDTPDNAVYLIYGLSSQFPAVLGYLNLHRDLLYQIKRPVLMAVSEYEIREIQKHAPDLYRYRSRTYNLKSKGKIETKPIFSESKPVYYKLPIFEEKIDADAIRDRIKLDEYMLGTITDDYNKSEIFMDIAVSYYKLDDLDKGDDYSRKSMHIKELLNDEKGIILNYDRLIQVFLFKTQYRKVIQLSRKLLKLNPTTASTYENLAEAYRMLGQIFKSLECLDKAIELDPQAARSWFNMGLALDDLGRKDEALKAFEKAIETDPEDAAAWANNGYALYYLGRIEESLKASEKAIEFDPQAAEAWTNKSSALAQMGRIKESLEASEKAVNLNPKLAMAWNNKGSALYDLDRAEEAIEALDKAIELDPKLAMAWSNKGVALGSLGWMEDALDAYEKAIEHDPKDAITYVALVRLYRKLGREADSIEACKAARDLFETESDYNRACFEAVCGSPDAALALLRTALEKREQTADWARRDPDFEPIRDDPRFAALLDEFSPGAEKGP